MRMRWAVDACHRNSTSSDNWRNCISERYSRRLMLCNRSRLFANWIYGNVVANTTDDIFPRARFPRIFHQCVWCTLVHEPWQCLYAMQTLHRRIVYNLSLNWCAHHSHINRITYIRIPLHSRHGWNAHIIACTAHNETTVLLIVSFNNIKIDNSTRIEWNWIM